MEGPLQIGSEMKIFMSQINVHQRGFQHSMILTIWLTKMTHSVYVNGLTNSGHDSVDGGFAWAQQHGLPLTETSLGTVTAE